jgi:hypothetical protein
MYDESTPVSDGDWVYWGQADGTLCGLDTGLDDVDAAMRGMGFLPA